MQLCLLYRAPSPLRMQGRLRIRELAIRRCKESRLTTCRIKYIPDGAGLPVPGQKRGVRAKPSSSNGKRSLLSDNSRSIPASPKLNGSGSPAVPLSQQQAEQAKTSRVPIIHLLALSPMTEKELRALVSKTAEGDFKSALSKVAHIDESTGKYELKKILYKELDVWKFDYASESDRQKVIDNAVIQYDKARLSMSEPEWQRLLPKAERNKGICLSKTQAQIAYGGRLALQGTPRPTQEAAAPDDADRSGDKVEGEKAASQAVAAKAKKLSESQAQAKRLLSKKPPKAAASKVSTPKASTPKASSTPKPAAPRTTPAKKEKGLEVKSKVMSSEFISESDDDGDRSASSKTLSKAKRPRPAEVDTSDSSVPLSKKMKKDGPTAGEKRHNIPTKPRISDNSGPSIPLSKKTSRDVPEKRYPIPSKPVSKPPTAPKPLPAAKAKRPRQEEEATSDSSAPLSKKNRNEVATYRSSDSSQTSGALTTAPNSTLSAASNKTKTTSPHKSSPLASSEPTNASDFEHSDVPSSSVTPARMSQVKNNRSPIHKRHQKSSSVASSTSSTSTRYLKPEVLDLARKYRSYYPKYEALYKELATLGYRDQEKERNLMDMHDRLSLMKKDIYSGVGQTVG